MLHEVRGPRRACVADFPSIFYLGCCILSGADLETWTLQKEVPTIPISREIFASSSKVGASLVAPRARLPNPFLPAHPPSGRKGRGGRARRRGEGGSASGDRTFRRFCPERRCGPRSAVGGAGRERAPRPMSVRRRIKKGSQAAERRWKCEGGREGGREEKKEPRNRQQQRRRAAAMAK